MARPCRTPLPGNPRARRRTRLAGPLAVPALPGLSLPAPPTARAAEAAFGTCKAVFKGGVQLHRAGRHHADHSIPDGLAGFVDRAAPGSTVRMGMHWYGPAGPKTGMPEAQDREVALRMVPEKRDESIGTPFTAAGPRGGSPWTWCASGCPGDGPDDADAVDQVKHAGDKLRATCGRTTDAFADKGGQGQARTGKAHGARGHPPSTARTRPARSGPSASRDAGFGGRTAPSSWDWFGVLKHFLIIGAHCSLTGGPP